MLQDFTKNAVGRTGRSTQKSIDIFQNLYMYIVSLSRTLVTCKCGNCPLSLLDKKIKYKDNLKDKIWKIGKSLVKSFFPK